MTAQCQSCTAPAELFLCEPCIGELRADLLALAEGPYITTVGGHTKSGGNWHIERRTPGLLANLNDVVTRQTRMGGRGGHRKRGDEMPALYDLDTADSGPDRIKLSQQGKASELQDAARNTLSTIVRDVCEKRRIEPPPTTSAAAAKWLATHVHTLACDSGAGQYKSEIRALVRKIEKVIDRPPAPRFCGQCDKMIDRKMCGLMLYARRDAIEITCSNPLCRTTHNIEALYNRWLNYIDDQIVPREQIIGNQRVANPELYNTGIMGALDEFVHWQTFNRWAREGHIKPVRYQRPNGRRGFFRHGDEDVPEYRVGDVRRVKRKMDQANPVQRGRVTA